MTAAKTVSPKRYLYNGVVLNVHDGDTVKVAVKLRRVRKDTALGDLGFHLFIEEFDGVRWVTLHCPFRLLGINAPELNTDAGKKARDYIQSLIKPGDAIRVRSSVDTHTVDPDKYGDRWDGVLVRMDGVCVNDEMVRSGHAKAWDGQGVKPV